MKKIIRKLTNLAGKKQNLFFFIIGGIVLIIVIWAGSIFITARNSDNLVNKGLALQQAGDLSGARVAYQAALDINDCNAMAWNYLGNAYRLEKKYTETWAAYSSAIDCNPRLELAYRNISATYYLWDDNNTKPEASQLEEILLQGVRANSQSVVVLEQMVKFYNRQGMVEPATIYQEKLDQIRK